jgi:hypothetical protein
MRSSAKSTNRRRTDKRSTWAWVLAPPGINDFIRLLSAWRLWILGGLIAAALGAIAYAAAPPPYRARATVNVDFHLEQAWPQNTDREQFYYLERETRKLMEIAQSDETLSIVTQAVPGVTVAQLRAGAAQISQPGNGGWHFYGVDRDPQRASMIASGWAKAFSSQVSQQVTLGEPGGLERFITADPTQVKSVMPERSVGVGTYMLVSLLTVLSVCALALLLVHPRP